MTTEHTPSGTVTCDHNLIPCRKWLRRGWVCVRCDRWFHYLSDAIEAPR